MPAGWMLAIVLASSQSQLPGPEGIPFFDKIVHFGAFGLLATLWAHALYDPRHPARTFVVATAITSLFGASDELHQSFRPGRSVEGADWVADTLGAIVASALYCFWPIYRKLMEHQVARPRTRSTPAPGRTLSAPSSKPHA